MVTRVNDRQKLLQAIRRSTPRKMPEIFLRGWSQAGCRQAPDDESKLPENHLVIELVALARPERCLIEAAPDRLTAIMEAMRDVDL